MRASKRARHLFFVSGTLLTVWWDFSQNICPHSWNPRVVMTNMQGMWLQRPWYWVYSVRSIWCHSNQVNAHASDTTIIITFDSQAHVIQVRKYWTKWETFHFALLSGNLFTQETKSSAWSQLNAGQVFGKMRVLGKSRNWCKLSLFRFHCSAWLLYFHMFPSILHPMSTESFNKL